MSTTLWTTSEGQAKVVLWVVVIAGLLMGEMPWEIGVAIIAGEQGVWTAGRTWLKGTEKNTEAMRSEASAAMVEDLRSIVDTKLGAKSP